MRSALWLAVYYTKKRVSYFILSPSLVCLRSKCILKHTRLGQVSGHSLWQHRDNLGTLNLLRKP